MHQPESLIRTFCVGFALISSIGCASANDAPASSDPEGSEASANLDAGPCAAQYSAHPYNGGDKVSNKGSNYQCKPYPYSGWCGIGGGYEPGVGFAWQDAWTLLGTCGGSTSTPPTQTPPTQTPPTQTPPPTNSTCAQWRAGTFYATGTVVSYNGSPYIAEHDNPGYDPTISTWFWDPYTGSGCGSTSNPPPVTNPPPTGTGKLAVKNVPAEYLPWLQKAANMCAYLDAPHLAAQIDQESRWDPNAVSWLGAQGLTQFLPGTWAAYGGDADGDGVNSPFDPPDAIIAQGRYMCDLVGQMGGNPSWTTLLWAYNAGPIATANAHGQAPTEEARQYADLILNQLLPKYMP